MHTWRVDCGLIYSKCTVTYLFVTVRIPFHHSRYSHLCTYNNASKSSWHLLLLIWHPWFFLTPTHLPSTYASIVSYVVHVGRSNDGLNVFV
jgi:hypothetical protein